jgi:hypothetical protein
MSQGFLSLSKLVGSAANTLRYASGLEGNPAPFRGTCNPP